MGTRPLLAFLLTIAVLFASALTGSAAASAATMNHDMQMMEVGHCSSPPSNHDGKSTPKQCCIAMCTAAVAVAPAISSEIDPLAQSVANFPARAVHDGCLGEIATPPPRTA